MLCPLCKIKLKETILCNTGVDYCPHCLGLWFERDELRQSKDEKDRNLGWLDIDLWKDETKFKISSRQKLCPACRLPLYEVGYGGSKVKVDVCNLCYGIWLDRGEFKQIITYLEQEAQVEILQNYAKTLLKEGFEIFSGPETLREEIRDFLIVLKLLQYKFASQHPIITQLISELPK